MIKPRLGFIGMGKVGSSLARQWSQSGYTVAAAYSRANTANTQALTRQMGAILTHTPAQVVDYCDLIFLTVSDHAIASVAEALAACHWRDKAVVHTSGVHSRDILQPLADAGAMTGGIHPAFPFSTPHQTILAGATFAIEADAPTLQHWLNDLVAAVSGQPLHLSPQDKALYHAALVIASNYVVTLYATAQTLLQHTGASSDITANILQPLIQATVQNIRQEGIPNALTGPLIRNDLPTIEAHLNALNGLNPSLATVYQQLARLSYPMLHARGLPTDAIEALLQQKEK